jgi:iron complex outermembrane receptor protein
VDAYWIRVNNAIVNIQGNSAAILNFCTATLAANPACSDVIVRPFPWTNRTAANVPTAVFQKWLNIASFDTHGIDFEANYNTRLLGRHLNLRALVSYQPRLIFDQGPFGLLDLSNAATAGTLATATPSFKYTLLFSYDIADHVNFAWMQRGRGSMRAFAVTQGLPERVFRDGDRVPAITYSNATLTFDFDHGPLASHGELFFNVQNLFNQQPKVVAPGANANPGIGLFGFFPYNGDDIVGRFFTAGVRLRF